MDSIKEIRAICKRYENADFDLQELQGRLSRVVSPEPDIHNINGFLFRLDNALEEIIFTKLESNNRKYGLVVIYEFLKKLEEIEKSV
jgi:C4-type Zn-finger protein